MELLCMYGTSICKPAHPRSLGVLIVLKIIVFWISGPISTCQAQPAFEAYAFNLLSTYIDTVSVQEN